MLSIITASVVQNPRAFGLLLGSLITGKNNVSFVCNKNNKITKIAIIIYFAFYHNAPQECQSLCQWTNKGLITSTPNCKLFHRGNETLGAGKVTDTICR